MEFSYDFFLRGTKFKLTSESLFWAFSNHVVTCFFIMMDVVVDQFYEKFLKMSGLLSCLTLYNLFGV
jgi:hypothetical protein